MKRIFASLLVVVMMLGLLTGCIRIERGEKPEEGSLDALEVSSDYPEKIRGGTYLLKKDGTLYALSNYIREVPDKEYAYGQHVGELLFLYGSRGSLGGASYGIVPIPVFEEGDKVLFYPISEESEDLVLVLRKVVFNDNYTIPFYYSEDNPKDGMCRVGGFTDEHKFEGVKMENLIITDSNGNEIKDYDKLEYGKECIMSWYVGERYNEYRMKANCRSWYYVNEDDPSSRFELIGELDDWGYIELDLSGLPSGIYKTSWGGGLVEIK